MDLANNGKVIREREVFDYVDPVSQESINAAFHGADELPIILYPTQRILLASAEVVDIPLGCLGHICLRSTFARLGLLSPPTVADPGFKGTLTMEVYNASKNPILIEPGVAMWSLHYLAVFERSSSYSGKYQGQTDLTIPKAI